MYDYDLFNQRCVIKRLEVIKDQYNRPKGEKWNPVNIYPCRLAKASNSFTQQQPAAESNENYTLYLLSNADVKGGDMAEVIGVGKFRLARPYKPDNHHYQVPAVWDDEL
ncbi:DUF3599 family protein [Paenibacillus spongiae]|uniref:DUF3599 family protein n=1 Tax=Paenibacillus spongiae TaxID=2909671 RepID=UPI0035A23EFC